MKTLMKSMMAVAACIFCFTAPVEAGVIRISPDATAAATVGEDARAAVKFNLSGLSGVDVGGAWLELDLSGVSGEARSEFSLFVAEDGWSGAGDVSGLTLSEEPEARWDIEVRDYQRTGGFVRFDITELVKAWIHEELTNSGVVMVTGDMTAASLSGQLAGSVLVVHE
jgi:hypothetical protein